MMEDRNDYLPTPLEQMRDYWRRDVRKTFWILTAVFLAVCALFGAVYHDDMAAGMEVLDDFREEIADVYVHVGEAPLATAEPTWDDVLETFGLKQWSEDFQQQGGLDSLFSSFQTPEMNASALLWNNITACVVAIALGLIPFLFLTLFVLFWNAVIIGALIGVWTASGMSAGALAAGLLPHGIFEIPAMILSFALGFTLCRKISARICRRRNARPLLAIRNTLMLFALVVLPLLAVAAALECWVTPELMARAMGG